mmetsp:Transcript_34264/g.114375  ORF Transcript_34264/g.114375 Transcript_34264/m.114375 type:complete len:428 (-) Transcript_34264:267-1550(-)
MNEGAAAHVAQPALIGLLAQQRQPDLHGGEGHQQHATRTDQDDPDGLEGLVDAGRVIVVGILVGATDGYREDELDSGRARLVADRDRARRRALHLDEQQLRRVLSVGGVLDLAVDGRENRSLEPRLEPLGVERACSLDRAEQHREAAVRRRRHVVGHLPRVLEVRVSELGGGGVGPRVVRQHVRHRAQPRRQAGGVGAVGDGQLSEGGVVDAVREDHEGAREAPRVGQLGERRARAHVVRRHEVDGPRAAKGPLPAFDDLAELQLCCSVRHGHIVEDGEAARRERRTRARTPPQRRPVILDEQHTLALAGDSGHGLHRIVEVGAARAEHAEDFPAAAEDRGRRGGRRQHQGVARAVDDLRRLAALRGAEGAEEEAHPLVVERLHVGARPAGVAVVVDESELELVLGAVDRQAAVNLVDIGEQQSPRA